ncbi:hypothetical protein BGZ57DRAFT_954196 [Hyaloscypha finlandica]|nr:hypothetical protein BGZ57DRAFT_954196 [Hyaloscypha finlandica]
MKPPAIFTALSISCCTAFIIAPIAPPQKFHLYTEVLGAHNATTIFWVIDHAITDRKTMWQYWTLNENHELRAVPTRAGVIFGPAVGYIKSKIGVLVEPYHRLS